MIYMDRINSMAPSWSHVLSDAPTTREQIAELEAFRKKCGAPSSALQLPPKASSVHLDLMRGPRARALTLADIVLEDTRAMVIWELIQGLGRWGKIPPEDPVWEEYYRMGMDF